MPAEHGAEQGKHCVAPLVLEKLEPSGQGMHTLSDVVVQGVCSYKPGEHIEQGVQTVDALVKEKFKPAKQGVHTLSEVTVQSV